MEQFREVISWCLTHGISFVCFRVPGEDPVLWASKRVVYEALSGEEKGFVVRSFVLSTAKDLLFSPDAVFTQGGDKERFKSLVLTWGNEGCAEEQPVSVYEKTAYLADLRTCIDTIRSGKLDKVILSRVKEVNSLMQKHGGSVFQSLENAFPEALCYIFYSPETGCWSGASPERLLWADGENGYTEALAATQRHEEAGVCKPWGEKELEEHDWVRIYLRSYLASKGVEYKEGETETVCSGVLAHLRTGFHFKYSEEGWFDLLEGLHPTPAIGGMPQQRALELIKEVEQYDRTYYCGWLGLLNCSGKSRIFVNLRCMKLLSDRAYFYAGGGITATSDPEAEWEETEAKILNTLTCLLKG